jgi:hypothetical protein
MQLQSLVSWTALLSVLSVIAGPTGSPALPFSGSLSIDARDVGTQAQVFSTPISVSGSGATAVADLDFSLPAAALGGSFFVSAAGASFPYTQARGTIANLAGSFTRESSVVTGRMGVSGSWLLGLFLQPPLVELILPLGSIGVGGSVTITTPTPGLPTDVTIVGGTWTSGTVTQQFFALPPIAASGFDSRDAAGIGALRLVSPFFVNTSIGAGNPRTAGFAILDLVFVPEPGTALLVASALAALAHARRSR